MKQAPHALGILKQALKLRRAIPESIANGPPAVAPWLYLFQRAFYDLVADRNGPDQPITWTARQHWAEVYGLDATATDLLHQHVRALDVAFLEHIAHTKGPPGKGATSGQPRTIRAKHADAGRPD